MGTDYSFDTETRILRVEFSGNQSFGDYVKFFEQLTEDHSIDRIKASVADLTGVQQMDVNIAGASAIGDVAKRMPEHLRPEFEAIVSQNAEHIGLISAYLIPVRDQRNCQIFKTVDEAEAWVRSSVGDEE